MNTRTSRRIRRFQLQILPYANSYYIERIAQLEAALRKKPRALQIDMIGVGEIPADFALIIRAALLKRSATMRIITNACSSLQGGSVLVWLLGDSRIIRDDAKVFFRQANLPETEAEPAVWKDKEPDFWDSSSDIDPEEGDYARALQLIDQFLPVKEMAGRLIGVPELRQFGLVENEKVDHFLATALGKERVLQRSPSVNRRKRASEESRGEPAQVKPEAALDFII